MNFGLRVAGGRHVVALPALLTHTAVQKLNGTDPGATSAIDTTGATLIVVIAATADGGIGSDSALVADKVGGTVGTTPFTLTNTAYASGVITCTGTFPSGGSNAYAGLNFSLQGCNDPARMNGCWPCTASTTTTITLTGPPALLSTSINKGYLLQTDNIWIGFRQETFMTPQIYYTWAPTCGAGHTFTMSAVGMANGGGSIAVASFSGTRVSSDPRQLGSVFYTNSNTTTVKAIGAISSGSWSAGNYSASVVGTAFSAPIDQVGKFFVLSGFTSTSAVNNGTWLCTASSGGTMDFAIGSGFNGFAGTPIISPVLDDINTLVITALSGQSVVGPTSVDSSFVLTDSYQGVSATPPVCLAYRVSPSTSPLTPTWTVASDTRLNSGVIAFAHR